MFGFYALFHKYICLISSENSLQWVFTLKHNWYKSSPSNTLGLFAKKILLYFCLNWHSHAVMASWIFCHLFTFYNLKGFTWIWKHIHFSMYFLFRSLKRLNNVFVIEFPIINFSLFGKVPICFNFSDINTCHFSDIKNCLPKNIHFFLQIELIDLTTLEVIVSLSDQWLDYAEILMQGNIKDFSQENHFTFRQYCLLVDINKEDIAKEFTTYFL